MTDLDELRRLAEAARQVHGNEFDDWKHDRGFQCATSPSKVLALLDEIAALRRVAEEGRSVLENPIEPGSADRLWAALAALDSKEQHGKA